MSEKKNSNKLFYFILVLIPVLFFVVLEFSLRLFEYGVDTNTWKKITESYYGLNPDVAKRYFSNVKNVPESIQDVFSVEKKPNTYRVFVLGGSSAAGYPFMPLGSFSRYIRLRLEQNYPDLNIEVVNLSLTAVNSYTIRDLIPDVLEKEPDLILIYAGHNEYYGALGAGSMESLGRSRSVVNFILSLNKYKTFQLVRDAIKSLFAVLSTGESSKSGTLMSRMAENQKIEYDSDVYNLGLSQFEGNIRDVIEYVKEKNVPLILSTVASNLKDLPPFIYDKKDPSKNAGLIFSQAQEEYKNHNFRKADSLFREAKDLDQLRFRAPEKLNAIVKTLALEFNLPLVQADSILSAKSPNGIIGKNLMTDHLHLTLEGYKDLGELFYNKIKTSNLLPNKPPKYDFAAQDSITRNNFLFSKLDSTIAEYKLRILKNDWPFTNPSKKRPFNDIIKPLNFEDSLASKSVDNEIDWHKAHLTLANYYIKKKNLSKFKNEMKVLLFQYPIITEYYELFITELMSQNQYEEAYDYLLRNNKIDENQFSTKWLGIISLSRKQYREAIKFLELSIKYDNSDAQVHYNLSGAYSQIADYKTALIYLNKCLAINPNYSGAASLKSQLERILANTK